MILLDAAASMTPNVIGAILGDLITFALSTILIGGGVWWWRRKQRQRARLAPIKLIVYECGRCGVVVRQRLMDAAPAHRGNGTAEAPAQSSERVL